MKLTITRGHNSTGKILDLQIDGQPVSTEAASLKLTGARSVSAYGGVFGGNWTTFFYGKEKKEFQFGELPKDRTEYAAKIESRVKEVREWIASVTWKETFNIEL